MLRPLNIYEQLRLTPFVQDHTLTVLFGTSSYDKVLYQGKDGTYSQASWDIPQAKKDCDDLREVLLRYQIGGEEDMYLLDACPTKAEFSAVYEEIQERLKEGRSANPRKNYLVFWLFAGHGLMEKGMQSILCNEFDPRTSFYTKIHAEAVVRCMAD